MGLLNNICKDEEISLIGLTDEIGKMLTGTSNTIGQGQALSRGEGG